jgi:hypothetical protein
MDWASNVRKEIAIFTSIMRKQIHRGNFNKSDFDQAIEASSRLRFFLQADKHDDLIVSIRKIINASEEHDEPMLVGLLQKMDAQAEIILEKAWSDANADLDSVGTPPKI